MNWDPFVVLWAPKIRLVLSGHWDVIKAGAQPASQPACGARYRRVLGSLRMRGLFSRHELVQVVATGALLALGACDNDEARPAPEASTSEGAPPEAAASPGEDQVVFAPGEREALEAREQAALAIESDPPAQIDEQQFYQLLAYHCGDCHLAPLYPVQEWSLYSYAFDDLHRLIEVYKVVPGAGEASRLVLRMRRGEMPPPSLGLPVMPEFAIDLISEFIDRLPPP